MKKQLALFEGVRVLDLADEKGLFWFANNTSKRGITLDIEVADGQDLDRLIGEWSRSFTAEQAMTVLQEAGVPAGVVQTAEDLMSDPQLKHRQHYRVLTHPIIGPHSYHAPACRLSETPCDIRRAGPTLGQDNDYVYKEVLGMTDDDISDMIAEGVITTEYDAPFKAGS